MTCRATRRERVLVVAGRPPPLPRDAGDLLPRRRPRRSTRSRCVADGPAAGTTDLAALERLLADAGPAGRRGDRRPAELPRPARADGRDRRGSPMPPARCSWPSSSRSRWPSSRRPASTAPTSPPARASRSGIAAAVRRPVPRHPRLDRRARPPDPRPARRDDHRPRRPARLRDDHARPRAGHPAREGGQQHLHEPGAPAPSPRASTSRTSARTGCATWPRSAPPGRPSSRRALAEVGRRPAPPGPVPQRVRDPGARTRRRSTAGCSTAASWPGSSWPRSSPTIPSLADGLLVCATEVTTPDEIERFAGALSDVLDGRPPVAVEAGAERRSRAGSGGRARGARAMSVTGPRLQPTIFEKSRPGRGGGKIPHAAEGRARPDPGRRPGARRRPRCPSSTSPRSSATTST